MNDVLQKVVALKRPTLLTQAARIRALSYDRSRDLPGLVTGADAMSGERLLHHLMALEEGQHAQRHTAKAGYSPALHITLLGAILGEVAALSR